MINAGRIVLWGILPRTYPSAKYLPSAIRTITTGSNHRNVNQAAKQCKNDEKEENTVQEPPDFDPPPPEVPRTNLEDFRRPLTSVMKDLFRGKLNTHILSYPDVINNETYYDLFDRCNKTQQILEQKKDLIENIDKEGKVSKDILLALRTQGFYGLNVPKKDGGQGYSVTETLRLVEELGVNLSLSECVIAPMTLGYKSVQLFGTEKQKEKYLPSLISGQKIGTICVSDNKAGCDPTAVIMYLNFWQCIL